MSTRRRFSRTGNVAKVMGRAELAEKVEAAITDIVLKHDPTIRKPAVLVASRLGAYLASSIAVQTQSVQRAFSTLEDTIESLGSDFVQKLVVEATRKFDPGLSRFSAGQVTSQPPPTPDEVKPTDDWAGPVAGPTVLERHYGIARSTLFRWQKRNEAIALASRSSSRFVFPLKQFVDARPAPGLQDLIGIFGDHRLTWRWLVTPSDMFDGAAPIETLLSGQVQRVVETAQRFGA